MESHPSTDPETEIIGTLAHEEQLQPNIGEGDIALSGLRKWFAERRISRIDNRIEELRVSDEVHRTIGEYALGAHAERETQQSPSPEVSAAERLTTTHRPITARERRHSYKASKRHHKSLEKGILAISQETSWSIGNARLGTEEHKRQAQSIRLPGKERRGMNKAVRDHKGAMLVINKTRDRFEEEAGGNDKSGRRRRKKLEKLTTKRTRLFSKLRGE